MDMRWISTAMKSFREGTQSIDNDQFVNFMRLLRLNCRYLTCI